MTNIYIYYNLFINHLQIFYVDKVFGLMCLN